MPLFGGKFNKILAGLFVSPVFRKPAIQAKSGKYRQNRRSFFLKWAPGGIFGPECFCDGTAALYVIAWKHRAALGIAADKR